MRAGLARLPELANPFPFTDPETRVVTPLPSPSSGAPHPKGNGFPMPSSALAKNMARDGPLGKPFCSNSNTTCLRPLLGADCVRVHKGKIQKYGFLLEIRDQMERRGCIKWAKLLSESEIGGFIHSIREADTRLIQTKQDQTQTGGRGYDVGSHRVDNDLSVHPGLTMQELCVSPGDATRPSCW